MVDENVDGDLHLEYCEVKNYINNTLYQHDNVHYPENLNKSKESVLCYHFDYDWLYLRECFDDKWL